MATFNLELTDIYDINYTNALLTTKTANKSDIVETAKAWAGFTGLRCIVEDFADMITIKPVNSNELLFVTFDYWQHQLTWYN